jgi:hypothetical protein
MAALLLPVPPERASPGTSPVPGSAGWRVWLSTGAFPGMATPEVLPFLLVVPGEELAAVPAPEPELCAWAVAASPRLATANAISCKFLLIVPPLPCLV